MNHRYMQFNPLKYKSFAAYGLKMYGVVLTREEIDFLAFMGRGWSVVQGARDALGLLQHARGVARRFHAAPEHHQRYNNKYKNFVWEKI